MPGDRDLQLAARNDGAPASGAYVRNFSRKVELLAAVREYCTRYSGHDDVLVLLPNAKDDTTHVAAPSTEDVQGGGLQVGVVYLLKSGNHFKIGKTGKFDRRKREIDLQLPERAVTLHSIETDDVAGIEAYWHNRFKDRRLNGEWFALSTADIKAFRSRKKM